MVYDEGLAHRIRNRLAAKKGCTEKKMFGGLCFLLNGHMCCGIVGDTLMVRVGPEHHETALAQPHARPMDFTGKPRKGMVYVDPAGIVEDDQFHTWIERGVAFTGALPPKRQ